MGVFKRRRGGDQLREAGVLSVQPPERATPGWAPHLDPEPVQTISGAREQAAQFVSKTLGLDLRVA